MPIDILIYALIAAGLVFWLRSVLGTRHGDERERPNPFVSSPEKTAGKNTAPAMPSQKNTAQSDADQKIDSLERHMSIEGEAAEKGLMEILRADREFDAAAFLRGAQDAFVMIVEAFAAGDRATLRDLLAPDVFNTFSSVIGQREKDSQRALVEIHAVRKVEVIDARLDKKTAAITVRFTSDETNVLRDKDDHILSGHPDRVSETIDIWTFSRDIKSRSPAWLLSATRDSDAAAQDHKTVPDSQ